MKLFKWITYSILGCYVTIIVYFKMYCFLFLFKFYTAHLKEEKAEVSIALVKAFNNVIYVPNLDKKIV